MIRRAALPDEELGRIRAGHTYADDKGCTVTVACFGLNVNTFRDEVVVRSGSHFLIMTQAQFVGRFSPVAAPAAEKPEEKVLDLREAHPGEGGAP